MRLARENDWGNGKIEGELLKLGYEISNETVGNILKRHEIPPAAERSPSPSWRHLMTVGSNNLSHGRNVVRSKIAVSGRPIYAS